MPAAGVSPLGSDLWVVPMFDLERLLVPGSTELPACRCGEEMHIDHTDPLPERADTHIRVYSVPRATTKCSLPFGVSNL